jgi:phosphoglycolate phosphatase-like HAD superfamily hydrolase
MQILLLDMDSVLLNPKGYYRALQETVRLVATALGYTGRHLTDDEIENFEAAGVTSEWESSAICACLMLRQVWRSEIDVDLPDSPPLPIVEPHGLDWPDIAGFFKALADDDPDGKPLQRAEALLAASEPDPEHAKRYRQLLRACRRIERSLTHRLFQELALGSPEFEATYGLEPVLHSPSYLFEYDESQLPAAHRSLVLAWLDHADHKAVIFTNRPSAPPDGYFDTPEAELGRKVVGLDPVPIVGAGGAGWLAHRQGLDIDTFLKPSPVHGLAALAMAQLGDQEQALVAAHTTHSGGPHEAFERLRNAQVYVFEDSVKGLRSAALARDRLATHGIEIDVIPLGVSPGGPKRERLRAYGAEVYSDISEALRQVPGMLVTHP